MELLQLRYFQVTASTENISQAAKMLHIAQPSLSQTIKRLETEIGCQLFDRSGRHIVLNDAGQIFLTYVNQVFLALNNAQRHLDALHDSADKTVSLHMEACSMLLPDIIKQIVGADEHIQFQVYQYPPHSNGESANLKLSAAPVYVPSAGTHLLLKEKIVLAVPKEHPLASVAHVALSQLRSESFIGLGETSTLRGSINYYCRQLGFTPDFSIVVDNPNVMRNLLRLKLGIALIPEKTWHGFCSDELTVRPITDVDMTRHITLSWNPDQFMTPAVELCKQKIIDFFSHIT